MKGFLLCIFFQLCIFANAQNWHWARKANATSSPEGMRLLRSDGFGNVYMLAEGDGGSKYGNTVLQSGYFIVKFDSLGSVLWAKNVPFNPSVGYSQIADLNVDNAGNIYITGRLYGNLQIMNFNFASNGQEDIFIVKLDQSGASLWGRTFGGTGGDVPASVVIDVAQNIYIAGSFNRSISFDNHSLNHWGDKFFLVKLNSSGQALWATKGDSCFGYASSMMLDKYANVYVVEENKSAYGASSIAKFDSSGTLISSKVAWGIYDYVPSFAVADNGTIYLLHNAGGHYGFVPVLVKYDPQMNEVWKRYTGTYYGCYQVGVGVFIDKTQNVYLAGVLGAQNCSGDSVYFQDQFVYLGKGTAPSIVKFDSSGNFSWAKKAFSTGFSGIEAMTQNKNCDLIAGGRFNSENNADTLTFDSQVLTSDGTWTQIFLAKLNLATITDVAGINSDKRSFHIFPNPSAGIFNLKLEKPATQICVYDVMGKCVLNKSCGPELNPSIDLSYHSKGIFFVEIISEGQKMINKIVVD